MHKNADPDTAHQPDIWRCISLNRDRLSFYGKFICWDTVAPAVALEFRTRVINLSLYTNTVRERLVKEGYTVILYLKKGLVGDPPPTVQ